MNDLIEKVLDLAKKRNSFDKKNPFYVNLEKYLERLYNEINEVKDELKEKNSVFLEDEIGDCFWILFCLSQVLEKEGKIKSLENIFKRIEKKYKQRLIAVFSGDFENKDKCWQEAKKKQKKELILEHEKLYGEKLKFN
ncbi:hypothetical protein BKN14_01605 [Candidatus Gracilibacteria bacterium HOT-871]|nr:hypothetical protein BKN14_01605 [Candidatus Gracilibacteria bacterium HOT-871]